MRNLRLYVCILLFSSILPVTIAYSASISPPVGVMRVEILPQEAQLVSLPLVPLDGNIAAIFGNQLDAGPDAASADQISKWNSTTQGYVSVFRAGNTGDTEKDGKWFLADGSWTPASMTLTQGEAFFLANYNEASTVFLTGLLPQHGAHTTTLAHGLNLFGYSFPTAAALNNTSLQLPSAYGAINPAEADQVLSTDNTMLAWLHDESGSPLHGLWLDEDSDESTQILQIGKGYWYKRAASSPLTWQTVRPYATDDFSTASAPGISNVTVDAQAQSVTLNIIATGQSGERLVILAQDVEADGVFTSEANWFVLAENVEPAGATSLSWTDTTFVNDSAIEAGPVMRLYAIADAIIDSDGDGVNDVLEEFVYGSDANDTDSDNDGLPDIWEATHGLMLTVDDSEADSDGDGFSNLQEYAQQTSPTSAPEPPTLNFTWPADGNIITNKDTANIQVNFIGGGGMTTKREKTRWQWDTNYTPRELAKVESIEIKLDDEVLATWQNDQDKGMAHLSIPVSITNLSDGSYTLQAQARWLMQDHPDTPLASGRTAEATLTVDRQAPQTPDINSLTVEGANTSLANNQILTESDTFSLRLPVAPDITSVVFRDNPKGHCFVAYPDWSISNEELVAVVTRVRMGQTQLTIRCYDAAGNPAEVDVGIERIAPSASEEVQP